PFVRVTSFHIGGTSVTANLVDNGGFEDRDLSGEQGNLDGWKTFDQPGNGHGRWAVQSSDSSPLSLQPALAVQSGLFQAMLDEQDLQPATPIFFFGNAPDAYQGSHALYQDIFIPASATRVTVSFSLYLDNSTFFGDTSANPPLDFSSGTRNQQVRVDLLNPQAPILETRADATGTPGVLKNLFITSP